VFLETKVWVVDYGYDQTLHAFDKSAAKLGVDQIDLLILHQPTRRTSIKHGPGVQAPWRSPVVRRQGPRDRSEQLPAGASRAAAGRPTDVVPAVNQIEVHPYTQQRELQAFNA
jgi:2,5-diketo-D-gluconate reductase A